MKRMKSRVAAKLKSSAGESLAEVLIALLIAALAMAMLASVISTSANIVTRSKENAAEYYAANNVLSNYPDPEDTDDKVEVTEITVQILDSDGNGVCLYTPDTSSDTLTPLISEPLDLDSPPDADLLGDGEDDEDEEDDETDDTLDPWEFNVILYKNEISKRVDVIAYVWDN